MMCITVTVLSINDCFFPSVTRQHLTNKSDPTSGAFISKNDPKGGSPVTKNDTATTEIYTILFVGSVRCV